VRRRRNRIPEKSGSRLDSGKIGIRKRERRVERLVKLIIWIISACSNILESPRMIFQVILRRFGVVRILILLRIYDTYHATKTLIAKLGLMYNTIHVCEKGCVLFRGEHVNVVRCSMCGRHWYRD
jgi:hypothetical protein